MAVPWDAIIGVLPSLLETAGKLFTKADTPPASIPEVPDDDAKKQLSAVIERLKYFESLEADQASLLKQTIEELQNVTVKSARTDLKSNIAIALTLTTLLFSCTIFFIK